MLGDKRLRNPKLYDKLCTAEEAANFIQNHDNVGISGFTPSGYPKLTTLALAEQIKRGRLCKISLWSGASVGAEVEEALAEVHGVEGRMPYYAASHKSMRRGINDGEIAYLDLHLSHFAQQIDEGFFGEVDVAIVEAAVITEQGDLILGSGVGNTPMLVKHARRVIVEVNTGIPTAIEGIHDIFLLDKPPYRREIPIYHCGERIGQTTVTCGLDKIVAIVPSDRPDKVRELSEPDEQTKQIAAHLMEFLEKEQHIGRLPQPLLPLQSGVGSIANAVLQGLQDSRFTGLQMYSEILQDAVFSLIESGKVTMASGCAFTPSPVVWEKYKANPEFFNAHMVLRPLDISNHPEVIRRLGVIALNTPIEFDIYGHDNSTHIMGNTMMNGIGGSGDYMRNGYLTIFTGLATAGKDKAISRVVPMCSHVDHTEHDTMVFITEYGVADVRGLAPVQRAKCIIEHCAAPEFREDLYTYLRIAERHGGHIPVDLEHAFAMHTEYLHTGHMAKAYQNLK